MEQPEKGVPDVDGRLDGRAAVVVEHERRERLTPSQLLFIARKGREAGCHALMNFFDHECGYKSRPVDREAQRDRVVEVISESTKTLAAALATLERLK
jgi:hypothetical protein